MTADKERVTLLHGDCRELLKSLPDQSIDSIVTDPPYELGFMGRKWDASGIAYDIKVWQECLRVLRPGGHLLAFGGTRTYHRMTCAIEDAGFEIRDCIMWVYGSGFPKSHDVSKAIDKAAGAEREVMRHKSRPITSGTMAGSAETRPWIERSRDLGYHEVAGPTPVTQAAKQWQGWGSALKPAVEPIVCARKPLEGTIADNVLRHGTGGINVDGCRVDARDGRPLIESKSEASLHAFGNGLNGSHCAGTTTLGRWPANLIHDGSEEVVELFPQTVSGARNGIKKARCSLGGGAFIEKERDSGKFFFASFGSAARFFYCAKTSPSERGENSHPTVKPLALMRYLCRLVTPPRGTVLDPFAGSGSTMVAARQEGFGIVGCELEAAHIEIIKRRLQMPPEPEAEQEAQPKKTDIKQQTKPQQLKLLL